MKNLLSTFAALILFSTVLFAQENQKSHNVTIQVPEVAMLGIAGNEAVTLSVAKPEIAGNALSFSATNSNLWLNFTSVVANSNSTRKITSAITSGNLPNGVSLLVAVGAYNGNGKGNKGTPVNGATTITGSGVDVVTGIKSAYTESGSNKGYPLTYSLSMNDTDADYSSLVSGNYSLTVTYTIVSQ